MKWIKHDTDANQDAKLQNVLLDYGLEGYGLFWYCIELIAGKVDKENITFELEHDARIIARNTGSTPQKIEEMMRYFVDQGLFENTSGVITCMKLAKRLDKSMTSNPEMRKIIENLNQNKTQLDGFVYLIEKKDSTGAVIAYKIGRSKNPTSRLAEISKLDENVGLSLSFLTKIKSSNCVQLETDLHRKFRDYRIHNEWFEPRKEILDYVMTMSDDDMKDKKRIDKKRKEKKPLVDPDLLLEITQLWNEAMKGVSPKIDLSKKSKVNDKRIKAIAEIIKTDWKTEEYPDTDYSDHEYWGGYIYRLLEIPELQWQRENNQLTFDQVVNMQKFERNLGYMRMHG